MAWKLEDWWAVRDEKFLSRLYGVEDLMQAHFARLRFLSRLYGVEGTYDKVKPILTFLSRLYGVEVHKREWL